MKLNIKPISVLLALFILCFTLYCYNSSHSIIEPLSNPAHSEFVSKGITNDITSLEDALHISKYQNNYQSILKDLMRWCDLEILSVMVSNKLNIQDGVDKVNTEVITSLNQFSQFRNTLQSVYDNILTNIQ